MSGHFGGWEGGRESREHGHTADHHTTSTGAESGALSRAHTEKGKKKDLSTKGLLY